MWYIGHLYRVLIKATKSLSMKKGYGKVSIQAIPMFPLLF